MSDDRDPNDWSDEPFDPKIGLPERVRDELREQFKKEFGRDIKFIQECSDAELPPQVHAMMAQLEDAMAYSLRNGCCMECNQALPKDFSWPPLDDNPSTPFLPEGWTFLCNPNFDHTRPVSEQIVPPGGLMCPDCEEKTPSSVAELAEVTYMDDKDLDRDDDEEDLFAIDDPSDMPVLTDEEMDAMIHMQVEEEVDNATYEYDEHRQRHWEEDQQRASDESTIQAIEADLLHDQEDYLNDDGGPLYDINDAYELGDDE